MISPEREAEILRLHHAEKWPIGTIACQLHVHHSTVRRVLAQAGAIGAPPAVMNAVTDAIGVRLDMPATPEKVWRALQNRQMPQAAE